MFRVKLYIEYVSKENSEPQPVGEHVTVAKLRSLRSAQAQALALLRLASGAEADDALLELERTVSLTRHNRIYGVAPSGKAPAGSDYDFWSSVFPDEFPARNKDIEKKDDS